MLQNIKRGIAMLSVASAINLSAQTTYKARVINQDTGEPIIGAVVKGNKGVEIYYFPNDSLIQVRAYNAVTTYDIFCLYHLRTKHQLQVGQGICNNPYGITKYYDKKGILLKEVDEEKECLFSIAQLINKIKKEKETNSCKI